MSEVKLEMIADAPHINLSQFLAREELCKVDFSSTNMVTPVYALKETMDHIIKYVPYQFIQQTLYTVAMVLNSEPARSQEARGSITRSTFYVLNVPICDLGDMAITICVEELDESPIIIFGRVNGMKEAGLLVKAPVD